jgi:ankyrin repeat protein
MGNGDRRVNSTFQESFSMDGGRSQKRSSHFFEQSSQLEQYPHVSHGPRNDSTDQLMTAILDGDIQGIRSIVRSRGDSLHSEYWREICASILPLHRAIAGLHFHGNGTILVHTIETLIQLGANVNVQDSAGNSPLHKVALSHTLFGPVLLSPSLCFPPGSLVMSGHSSVHLYQCCPSGGGSIKERSLYCHCQLSRTLLSSSRVQQVFILSLLCAVCTLLISSFLCLLLLESVPLLPPSSDCSWSTELK